MKHTALRAWLAVTCKPKIDIARTYVEVKPVVYIAMMCLIYHTLLPIVLLRDLLSLRSPCSRNLFGKARSLPSGRVGEFSLDLGHGTTSARFLARNATFLLSAAHGLPSSAGGVYIGRRRGWSWDRLRCCRRYRSTEIASEDIFSPA